MVSDAFLRSPSLCVCVNVVLPKAGFTLNFGARLVAHLLQP